MANFAAIVPKVQIWATLSFPYFLRRFLDKDYITKNIVYTGFIHTIEYLYFLVKHYDFKIIEINPFNSCSF